MHLCPDGVEPHEVAREVECGDLLVALFGDGIALNGSGTDRIQRFQLIPRLKQRLALLNRLFPLNDVIKLVQLMLIKRKRDTQLADAAILTVDRTTELAP